METSYAGLKGGSRPNAGIPAGYVKSQDLKNLDAAKARNEAAKAELNEHELQVKRREYLPRSAIIQASATAMAAIAQALRSIEDRLENEGVPVDVCLKVGTTINSVLEDLANDLAMMTSQEE